MSERRLRVLIIASKCPYPPNDGGRLALALMIDGLIEAGVDLRVLTPANPADHRQATAPAALPILTVAPASRAWPAVIPGALWRREPFSLARHRQPALARLVGETIADWQPDLVHVEALQALPQAEPAWQAKVPVLLRLQNVESALWRQVAGNRWPLRPLAWEANRLARFEAQACARVARTLCITEFDRAQLCAAWPEALRDRVFAHAQAMPSHWPNAAALDPEPAVVLFASPGWHPNQDALQWFKTRVWPELRTRAPTLPVYAFGETAGIMGVRQFPAPEHSMQAFPANAVVALPLRLGSGVRMRLLEAWARGLPVVATSAAARGLDAHDQQSVLIADAPGAFADALLKAVKNADLRAQLIEQGRACLRAHHDPRTLTKDLLAHYAAAIRQGNGR